MRILFVIEKARINAKGLAPLRCRVIYQKNRKIFSTGLFINPDHWNSKKQKAHALSPENEVLNNQLSLIRQKVNQAFLMLKIQKDTFDVEDIYLQYKGENIRTEKSLLEAYNLHNVRMKKLIGIEYSESTYKKFEESKNHIKSFMKHKIGSSNILLKDLNMKFLHDFDYYMKVEKKLKQVTINKHIERLRKIIKLALAEGFLERDPFLLFSPKKIITEVIYLNTEELKLMEKYSFSQERLQKVADMFIFCCYTGLPYQEMASLKHESIIQGNDSHINTMAKDYYEDQNFSRMEDGRINLWSVFNLFTQANKSSYIDTFLDRNLNAFEFSKGIQKTLNGDSDYHWFLS